jgi:predicted RNA polymerase sigma factor
MIEPLATPLSGYFHNFALEGGLLRQLRRTDDAKAGPSEDH